MTDEVTIASPNLPAGTKVIYIEKVSTYDPWISIKKMLSNGGIVAIIAFLTYLIEIGFPTLMLELPEYVGIITITSGIVTFILNWLKHRKDSEEVQKEATIVSK